MTAGTATLSNYRQAPRKVRLVADAIRGKSVPQALAILSALPKRASLPMEKLLRSAVANSKDATPEQLVVERIEVNLGTTLHRFMPRARGRASAIKKKNSHISISLGTGAKAVKAVKVKKVIAKKAAPKKKSVAETTA